MDLRVFCLWTDTRMIQKEQKKHICQSIWPYSSAAGAGKLARWREVALDLSTRGEGTGSDTGLIEGRGRQRDIWGFMSLYWAFPTAFLAQQAVCKLIGTEKIWSLLWAMAPCMREKQRDQERNIAALSERKERERLRKAMSTLLCIF